MEFYDFHIVGIIIPTDELIFFRGVETTNQVKVNPLVNEVKCDQLSYGSVEKRREKRMFWCYFLPLKFFQEPA